MAALAAAYGTDGPVSTAAALLLAPLAVLVTWRLAKRLGGRQFATAAAIVYVLLPALAASSMLGTYRSTFAHAAIPDLVGLRATPWFAGAVAIALAASVLPANFVLLVVGVPFLIHGWGDLGAIRIGLHETAWSITMLEWLIAASILGASRRSWVRALGLAGWLAFAIGHAARQGYDGAAFWQSLAIATPAVAVLLSSLWFLVPQLRSAPEPEPTRAR